MVSQITGNSSSADGDRSDIAFSLDKVTFFYGGNHKPVLKDISFAVKQGEFVGIVGPTASGRSTLLYLLTGVIPHYFKGELLGQVSIFGRSITDLRMGEITSRVGFVMQDPEAQLFNLYVEDEVAWGLECRGVPRETMRKRVDNALQHFGISHLKNRVTYDLSGGEKQKVAITSIDAIGTEAVVFDNPTSQLDPVGRRMVHEAVHKLSKQGRAIVMVDDSIDDLIMYADRLLLIDEGQVRMDVTVEEFCLRRKEVHDSNLKLPQIVELAHELREEGVNLPTLPITLSDGIQIFAALINSGRA